MESYCKLSILKLKIFLTNRPLDLFVCLSETKYVKVVSREDLNPNETLDNYLDKGLNSLYIRRRDFDTLMVEIESNINETVGGFAHLDTLEKQYEGLSRLLEDTKSLVENLGITKATARHVDQLVQKTIYSFSKWDSIEVLTELLFKKNDYIKSHGLLCSYIATTVFKKIDWSTDAMVRKVIMASLFQNICLDKDLHAKIYDCSGEDFCSLEQSEKDIVLGHPQRAARLLDYGEFTGLEVASMVKNQHELPGKGGFPRSHLSVEALGPLETSFIISSFFAHRVLTSDERPINMGREVQDLNELFYEGTFKKSFENFLGTFR